MTRFPRFRATLRNIVIAALPLCLAIDCGYSAEEFPLSVEIDPDGVFAQELEDCLSDDLACAQLCDAILVKQGYAEAGQAQFLECRVMFEGPETRVLMTYTIPYDDSCGRRPPGLCAGGAIAARSAVGARFAAMAHLEAASVHAFATVARELAHHGAPRALVVGALRAAQDEVRHTAITAGIARAWGAVPVPPQVPAAPLRSLYALCLENAVEGCVRETMGAAVATWAAHVAGDRQIRAAMRVIAEDETRHAELSAAIDAWALPQLTEAQRKCVEYAKRLAALELVRGQQDPPADVVRIAGLPRAVDAVRLAIALEVERRRAA